MTRPPRNASLLVAGLALLLAACAAPSSLEPPPPIDFERLEHAPTVLAEIGGSPAGGASASTIAPGAAGAPVLIADAAPSSFLPLALFGGPPQALPADDGGLLLGLDGTVGFCGRTFDTLLWSLNGTVELGGGTGAAAPADHAPLPDGAAPNRLLAPWWSDLDLTAGSWYLAYLSGGGARYVVLEWNGAATPDGATVSFQVWMLLDGEAIWFVYGPHEGSPEAATVGVEDASGTLGDTRFHDGAGTSPWGGTDLRVDSSACSEEANAAPIADAGGSTWTVAGADALFDGSASFDPDGDPLTYAWEVDGAAVGSGPQLALPTTPADAGRTFEAELRVTDPHGAAATDVATVAVLSADDAIALLMAEVDALVPEALRLGQAHGLTRPLHNARSSLSRGNLRPACSQLGDFVAGLEALDPPLAPELASPLLGRAGVIGAALGCD